MRAGAEMTQRVVDEWVGGYLPDAWLPPISMTDAGPGLGACAACGHQQHGAPCAYRSHDSLTGIAACGCRNGVDG